MIPGVAHQLVPGPQAILNACYDLVAVVDEVGRITTVNEATRHLFDRAPSEVIGLLATDLVHPDDLASLAIAFDRIERRIAFPALICRFAHHDGSWVPLELIGNFRFDDSEVAGLVITGRAVTTQPATTLDIGLADTLFGLIHYASEAMVVIDHDGQISLLNHSMRLLMGLAAHEQQVLRWPGWFEIRHVGAAHSLPASEHPLARCLAGTETNATEYVVSRRDGSQRHVVLRGVPRPGKGGGGALIMVRDVTEDRVRQAELVRVALFDPLTGLANRAGFDETLRRALEGGVTNGGVTNGGVTVVLCCALDRFSVVDFGPELGAGDQVLCHYAALLTSLAGPNDTPARLGGDEFALLCLADTVAGAVGLAERLCTISAPGQPLGPPIMTASVGLAVAEPASTARQLLRDAQAAMRHAKHNGRHRIEVFEPVMRSAAVERAVRHEWLRDALASDALELHFQPIIDSSTGHIVAAEALIRGRLDNGELLMPNQFLPVAYRMGLALELDAWVLDHALDTVQRWYARYGAATPAVSINLSSQQLTRRDLSQDILDRLEQRRLPRSLVWLEVTETAIAGAQDRGVQSLHELRSAGIELAIDDFGTGASSLGRLRDLPFTLLKIDRSFVAALPGLLRDESIVTAIGELASALGMEIIAEGVEHTNQLNALRRAGCSWLQGFLFSKPVVEASLLSRLDNPDPAWSWALGLR